MRDNEALKMDPTPPSYPPTRTPVHAILPLGIAKAESMFIQCQIYPQYTEVEVTNGFTAPNAGTPIRDAGTVARFCAQVAQIERVYCKRARS